MTRSGGGESAPAPGRRSSANARPGVGSAVHAGACQAEIAEEMNKAGLPTPGGSTHWWPSHVSRLLKTQDAQARAGKPPQKPTGLRPQLNRDDIAQLLTGLTE